jgi:hypothetical protein
MKASQAMLRRADHPDDFAGLQGLRESHYGRHRQCRIRSTGLSPALCIQICQIFGNWYHSSEQQMLARPRAGDIEKASFGLIDVVKLRLIRGIGNAFVER